MVILDGDETGLDRALELVWADPRPEQVDEYRAIVGRSKDIGDLLDDSIAASAFVAYAERDGEAMVGGVVLDGFLRHEIWLLTTRGAARFPRWLVWEGKRMLAGADAFFKWPYIFVQAIPEKYGPAVAYAKHLGFREVEKRAGFGDVLVVLERMVPKWAE